MFLICVLSCEQCWLVTVLNKGRVVMVCALLVIAPLQRTESTSEPGLHCCAKFTPPALVAHPVPQFRTGFILHQALDLNRIGYRAPVYVVAPGSVVGSQAAGSVATTRPSETPRGPREVVEGGIRYVMTPKGDQCLVNRPNVWNGEELCECRSDGCRDCDDRLSTVAQKEDDENASSIADESVLSTHAASPVDDQSIRSENGEKNADINLPCLSMSDLEDALH